MPDDRALNAGEMTRPLQILVVDDNPDHGELVVRYLQACASFTVDVALDLEGLWTRLAEHAYDLVLLDYHLPDGNGLQALAEFPARGHRLPVVMVTGHGDERVAVQAMQHGAIDYLVKSGGYLHTLPTLVEKAVRTHRLMLMAEQSLERVRYQALLLNNVRDAVVVWDLAGRITFWNRAAEALFGWSADERLGQSARTCYHRMFTPPVELPPLPDSASAPVDVERHCLRRTGDKIWVSSIITALQDANGRLIGHMDVSRDITARKWLEDQVQATQLQLAQAARLAAIGELASGVAHQISNPLATVIGDAQILLRRLEAGHPARESAEAIERAGWRAQESVQRLIDFSRPASSRRESLSVNQTVEHALALVGAQIEAAGVTLKLDLAESLPPVVGTARQLEDLWVNLLLVARGSPAGEGPRRVTVRTRSGRDGRVTIEINDDGELIPPAKLASIFEPSFTDPPIGTGTGLELSLCREIVRQHRGEITVESTPDHGTTFTVSLPSTHGHDPIRPAGD